MSGQNTSASGAPMPQMGGFSKEGRTFERWDTNVNYFNFPGDGEYHSYRFFGPVRYAAQHWLKSISGKNFPVSCLNYDHTAKNYTLTGCPVEADFNPKGSMDDRIKKISPRQLAYGHMIVRSAQQQGDQVPWKPVRVPMGVIVGLEKLQGLNIHMVNGKTYKCTVSDPYYGIDVWIAHSPKEGNPNNRYSCQKGDHTPLTEVELAYLQQLHDWDALMKPSSAEEIKTALQMNGYYQILNGGTPTDQTQGVSSLVLPQAPPVMAVSVPPLPSPGQPQPYQQQQPYAPPAPQAPAPQQMAPAPQPTFQPTFQPAPVQAYPQPVPQAAPQPVHAPIPQGAIPTSPADPVAPPPPMQGMAPMQPPVQPQMAPVQPMQPPVQPQMAPVHQMPQPVAPSGETQFTVQGQPAPVSRDDFQRIVLEYGSSLEASRSQPYKVSDKSDDTSGLQVLACFASYKGDPACIRCPLRRFCLQH